MFFILLLIHHSWRSLLVLQTGKHSSPPEMTDISNNMKHLLKKLRKIANIKHRKMLK